MSVTLPTIAHLDADAFFVSCELGLRPELRGTKCAVGGRERGIISSASYEARACGVYTPMPTQRALQVCPDLIMLPPTSGLYSRKSCEMFDQCETLTPLVQRNSIDEGYLDLGPCGFRSPDEIERHVRAMARLLDELNRQAFPYRWSTRAIMLDKTDATKLLAKQSIVNLGDDAQLLAGANAALLENPALYDSITSALNAALDASFANDPIWGPPKPDGVFNAKWMKI